MIHTDFTEEFQFWYQAIVLSVHDGDTMTLNIDLGRRTYTNDSIRLYRINAPELSQAGGREARDFLRTLCPIGSKVRVRTFKNAEDKYGRWLGDVYCPSHYESDSRMLCVNDRLVATGHAKYLAGFGPSTEEK